MAERTKKILRVITRMNVGGPSFHVQTLRRHLDPTVFDQRILSGVPTAGETEAPFARETVDVFVQSLVRGIGPIGDFSAWRAIRNEMRAFRPDIVHTHQAKAGALARLAASAEGVRGIVHTYHGHVFEGYFGGAVTRAIIGVERCLARRTHILIAQSESQRRDILGFLGDEFASKLRIVEPAVDFARFGDEEILPVDGPPTMAFVGRIAPVKRLDVFLWMVKAVRERLGRSVHAIVAAGGAAKDVERMRSLAKIWGIADDVEWVGATEHPEAVLRRSHVLCMTSRMEGTPLAMIEALGLGTPVVAFAVGGIEDVAKGTGIADVRPREDALLMVDALARRLEKPPSIAERKEAAAFVRRRFGVERLAAEIGAIYREITSGF